LQDRYDVTSSTDINVLKSLSRNSYFDLLVIDSEPDCKVEELCSQIKSSNPDLKIILTYVYDKKMNLAENRVKKIITGVLYKPFDLSEFAKFLPSVISEAGSQAV
jgi:DNA-binding NtrC family response regulator